MMNVSKTSKTVRIGHFTVVYLIAKPLIWSEAEGDLVVIETSILESMITYEIYIWKTVRFVS